LAILNLNNEDFNDFLFYRKLEISANNFNLIEILHDKDELKKEVFMCNISNGVKIFMEKKECVEDNEEIIEEIEKSKNKMIFKYNILNRIKINIYDFL
jgi:hypothetical protein